MRKVMLVLAMMAANAVLGGCANPTRPYDDYTPLNTIHYSSNNRIKVGEFTYSAMQTKRVRSDQIETTAIGNIYLGMSIADLVRKGTIEELNNAGLVIRDDADIVVTGDVSTFKADDLGYSIHWTIGIMYTISRKSTNEKLFSRYYNPPARITKKGMYQAEFVGEIHKTIADACGRFMRDPDVRNILDAPAR